MNNILFMLFMFLIFSVTHDSLNFAHNILFQDISILNLLRTCYFRTFWFQFCSQFAVSGHFDFDFAHNLLFQDILFFIFIFFYFRTCRLLKALLELQGNKRSSLYVILNRQLFLSIFLNHPLVCNQPKVIAIFLLEGCCHLVPSVKSFQSFQTSGPMDGTLGFHGSD